MKTATNYLKNVMKSVAYAAADVSGDYMPNMKEFTSTNKEFATATYASLKNPKSLVKRQIAAIQESKVYKTLDYGIKNLSEDLRTGNFYNKARKERDELALAGLDTNWDDLSEFGVDDDWENKVNKSSSNTNEEITAGDLKIVESIEGSNAAVASATVNAVIATSQNEIKNSRINTATIYTQNEKLFGGLHKDITILGSTMQQMYKLQSTSLQNIDKNMSDFFTQESKLNTERNAILKEILEIQRNVYKSAADKEKENISKKKSSRIRWSDINVNGIPDLSAYFDAIKKNINNQLSSIIPSGFGDDSNMLAQFMISPLEGVMKYVVNGVIPATVKAATKEFDETISGVFGNIIARLGKARSDDNGGLLGTIAKFLGISTSINRNIDTSKYEKGPIPFDGITRKAIIDVIPTHLRRIEAAITGRPEEIFDYKTGRWIQVSKVKKQFEDIRKSAINRASSTLIENMNPGIQTVRKGITNKLDRDNWDKAIEEFKEFLYDNASFNPNLSASKNGINAANYPHLYRHYNKIKTIYNDFDRIKSTDSKGNKIIRNTKHSVRVGLPKLTMEAREYEDKQYREIETDIGNVLNAYFGIPKADAHGRYKSNGKFEAYNILNNTKDNLGNTIFDYLQNINKELTWFRMNGASIGGGRGNYKGARNYNKSKPVSMDEIQHQLNKNVANSNNIQNQISENDRIRKSALDAIASGDAIDLRDFDVDEQVYLLNLSTTLSNNAVTKYKSEIEGYNNNVISKFIDKHFIKTNYKSLKDIDNAIKKANEEGKNTNEVNMDEKEEKFFKKILKHIGGGESILGGVIGASSEAFTNLLYTADKAIYEMLYKAEISDDKDKKKYNGFMDAMVGKMSDKFKELGDWFKRDIIDPFKERFNIGDDFKDRFKSSLINAGSKLWTSFKDANIAVYGPAYHDLMAAMGFEKEQTKAQKKRAHNRELIKSKIKYANKTKNLYDEEFISILRDYGLNFADYGNSLDAAKKALLPLMYEDMYKNSNELREFDNSEKTFDMALKALLNNPERILKTGKRLGTVIKGDTDEERIEWIKKQTYKRADKSAGARRGRQAAVSNAKDAVKLRTDLAEEYGFVGTVEQKQEMLKSLAKQFNVTIKNISRYDNDDALNKAYIRIIENHNAKGTQSGIPFTGLTTLTKGEGLISNRGIGVVPKTGVYNITTPTHIINTEDMHSITGGPRVSVQSALGKEKLAAKAAGFSVKSNAKGTMKITNNGVDIDTEEFLSEAKKFIPEAAGGGLIGGILSMILGLAGGPLLGAAIGAGSSIIASSSTLKNKLFGKAGSDGKRDGSGIISKSIVNAFNKYFPDMAKYGLAGIIPGLITPLGPVGGLMAGAAFGFLKNNEKFTNKYFGEEGKLTIKSKDKKIIEKMLPAALKGAGAGAILGVLFGGPFGLLGNAALGSGIGMMTATEDFKNLILGEKIDDEHREGGIVGAFKDALEPFTESMKNAGSNLANAFDKHIINPLANLVSPAINAIPIALGTIPRRLNALLEKGRDKIHATSDTRIGQFVGKHVRRAGNAVEFASGAIGKLLSVPGWAMNTAGDALRAYDIRHGVLPNMTQQEAVKFMDDTGRERQVSSILRASSKVGSGLEKSMTKEQAETFRNQLLLMNDTELSATNNFRKQNHSLNKLLTGFKTLDGKKLSDRQVNEILIAAKNKDYSKIANILQKSRLKNSKEGLSEIEFDRLMNEKGLKKAISDTAEAEARLNNIKHMSETEAGDEVKKKLEEIGIKGKDADAILNNKRKRAEFASLLSDQLTHLEANPNEIKQKLETETHDHIKNINELMEDVVKLMLAEKSGDKEDIDKTVRDINNSLNAGINKAKNKYSKAEEKARERMGDAFNNIDNPSNLTNYGSKWKTKLGINEDILNSITGDAENIKKAFKKKNIKNIQSLFEPDGISKLSELVESLCKIVINALDNYYINQAIQRGEYHITKETISLLCDSVTVKEVEKQCVLLDQIYNKIKNVSIYKEYTSLEDLNLKLTPQKMFTLSAQYDINYFSKTSSGNLKRKLNMGGRYVGRGIGKAAKVGLGLKLATALLPASPIPYMVGAGYLGYKGIKGAINFARRQFYSGAKVDEDAMVMTEAEMHNSEENQAEPNAYGTIAQNGLGTALLGGLFNVGKAAVHGATSVVKSLFKKKDKNQDTNKNVSNPGILGSILNMGSGLVNNIKSGFSSGTDEIDDPNDGKEIMPLGDTVALYKKDSSNNIEPDTSNPRTKSILNKLTIKEKMTNALQEAQLKASNLITNTFDTTNVKGSNKGKLGWFSLLLGGAVLWKSGVLKKIFDGVVKPLWTEHIKPWIGDTAIPWIKDTWSNKIRPWITDTAIPALGNLFSEAIGVLIANLPQIIWSAIKGLGKGVATTLDIATGNKYNAGGKTTVSGSNLVNKYGEDLETGMYDENGNTLTAGDIKNGNYKKIYNGQGVEGTVDKYGNVTFKDKSLPGMSYATTVGNAAGHGFAKSMATGRVDLMTKYSNKFANFLAKRKGIITKIVGRRTQNITKPIQSAENLGVKSRGWLNNKIDSVADNMINKAIANGTYTDELAEAIVKGDGSKTSKVITKIADWTDNGIVGRGRDAAANVTTKTKDAITKINTKVKDLFKSSSKEIAENATKEASKTTIKETIETTAKEAAKDAVAKATEGTAKKAVQEVAEETVENTVKAAAENATKTTKNVGFLGRIIAKAKSAIGKLFSNSTVKKKLMDAAESLGIKNVNTWIKGFKNSIDDIFTKALEKGIVKVGKETCKKVVSKVLWAIYLVTDFITGCDQAEAILGVTETSVLEELAAGLINALCNLLIIPSIFPGTNSIARKIFELFGQDLSERQAEATKEYEEYIEKTGKTWEQEEYLKRKYSATGAAGGWLSDTFGGVWDFMQNPIGNTIDWTVDNTIGKDNGVGKFISNAANELKYLNPVYAVSHPIKTVEHFIDKVTGFFNAEGTTSLSNLGLTNNTNLMQNIIDSTNNDIVDLNEDIKFDNLEKVIGKAENGKISIYSKEYWKNTKPKGDSFKDSLENAYSNITKLMKLPVLMVKNSLDNFTYDIEDISDGITDKSSNKLSNNKSKTKIGSSLKSEFAELFEATKGLFGGAYKDYEYGTGAGIYSKQIDPSIAGVRFNTSSDSEYQTIGNSGCGPAAAVNAIESMYGRGNSIVSAAEFAVNHGYKETNGGTKPGFFTDYFNRNGFGSKTSYSKSDIAKNIRRGMPTVIMGHDSKGVSSSTPFGKVPHYVTVTGVDGRGNAIVQDPESRYDNQLYPLNSLMKNTSFGVSAFGRGKWGRGSYDEQIWGYLKQMGLTDAGAAGLMGNLYAESGLNPANAESMVNDYTGMNDEQYTAAVDNGTINKETFLHPKGGTSQYGYGLAQWTSPGRKEGLYNLVKERGVSISDLSTQLEWLNYELNNNSRFANVLNVLKTTNDLREASNIVLTDFESPRDQSIAVQNKRLGYSQGYLDTYKGSAGSQITGFINNSNINNTGNQITGFTTNKNVNTNNTNDTLKRWGERLNLLNVPEEVRSNSVIGRVNKMSNLIFSGLTDVLSNSKIPMAFNIFGDALKLLTGDIETSEYINPNEENSGYFSGGGKSFADVGKSLNNNYFIKNTTGSETGTANAGKLLNNNLIGDAARVVEIARGEIGTAEVPEDHVKYNDWYWGENGNNAYPWCAAFVSWVANQAGIPTNIIPKDAYTVTAYQKLVNNGGQISNSEAKPGDIIYFSNDGTASKIYHTGIVVGNDGSTISTVEGNSGAKGVVGEYNYDINSHKILIARPQYTNAGTSNNYSNNSEITDAPEYANTRGGNGIKPLSRYGQFKESIYGKGSTKVLHKTKDGYVQVVMSDEDRKLGKALKLASRRSMQNKPKTGMGTTVDYSKLINAIISILMTIADNTDKLNLIVTILNEKLNLSISASDVSNVTATTQSLKSKLSNALMGINNASKLNSYTDNGIDPSINSIISAMNAIASE